MKLKLTADDRRFLREDEDVDPKWNNRAAHDLDAMEAEIARLNEIKNRIQKSFLEEIGILIQETRDLKFTIARSEKENAALRKIHECAKELVNEIDTVGAGCIDSYFDTEFSEFFPKMRLAFKEYEANHGA